MLLLKSTPTADAIEQFTGEVVYLYAFDLAYDMERKQIDRVQAIRAGRDTTRVEKVLAEIKQAGAGERNLMPLLIEAARAHVSEGEIVQALQEVWGDYRETPVF